MRLSPNFLGSDAAALVTGSYGDLFLDPMISAPAAVLSVVAYGVHKRRMKQAEESRQMISILQSYYQPDEYMPPEQYDRILAMIMQDVDADRLSNE